MILQANLSLIPLPKSGWNHKKIEEDYYAALEKNYFITFF